MTSLKDIDVAGEDAKRARAYASHIAKGKKEIKYCPFCGRGSLRVASVMGDWHVRCISCHAQGPTGEDREGAIVLWNHLRSPSSLIREP